MDGTIKKEKNFNPFKRSTLLSKLTFFHTYPLYRLGLKKDIEDCDIYEISNSYKSKTLGNRLEELWKKEVASKKRPNIVVPLIKLLGLRYALIMVPYLFATFILLVAKPLLLGQVLNFFNSEALDNLARDEAIIYSFALSMCVVSYTLVHHFDAFAMELTDLKAKAALSSLIYKKSLRLQAGAKNSCGQAVTLMTKDAIIIESLNFSLYQTVIGPMNIIAMTVLMYYQIGLSSVFGTAFLLLLIPLQAFLGTKVSAFKLKTSEKTDQRIQVTQEVLNSIQVIKMYTWQKFFYRYINKIRSEEIRNLRILYYIKAVAFSIGQISSKLALYVCIITYVYMGYHLTAERAYVVIECLGTLHLIVMYNIPKGIAHIAEFHAAMRRITNFLLLPEVSIGTDSAPRRANVARVSLKQATVVTDTGDNILSDVSLEFKPGLCAVTGLVGCGKSTLMRAILGEVSIKEGTADVRGIISYASQQAWVFPGTVRQNIIFCEQFDKARYESVIRVCALEQDLNIFSNGDMTSVSDGGANLSGGQRSRINLARAIYKKADIYLLDDSLSAIDTHISSFIFRECIKDFLKNKICIFATQQHHFLKEVDTITILSEGKVKFNGTYTNLKDETNEEFKFIIQKEIEEDDKKQEKPKKEVEKYNKTDKEDDNKKGVYDETKEIGSVKGKIYLTYFLSGGGLKMFLLVTVFAFIAQAAVSWTEFFISTWVRAEKEIINLELTNATNTTYYTDTITSYHSMLQNYSFILLGACILTAIKTILLFVYCGNISTNIHAKCMDKIIRAKMVFFYYNLSGNILNRFSRDLGAIDEIIPYILFEVFMTGLILLSVITVSSIVNQYFLIPSVSFTVFLLILRKVYLPIGRSLKRLQGTTRSAVVGHTKSTFEGLTTIRASHAQDVLYNEYSTLLDHYHSSFQMTLISTRAFVYYCDLLCSIFISSIILAFPFLKSITPAGQIGLTLTQLLSLTGYLQWGIRQAAELEIQMTSAERMLQYTTIESENEEGDIPPHNWPERGRIQYSNVTLRYCTGDVALKDVNFVIESKQKIGIVGRTGAGKSSIISTLLRLYEYDGRITIDDVDINALPVGCLRSNIAMIPQNPVLFSGSIRSNLDPHDTYTDACLWDALKEVNMINSIQGLEDAVSEGGINFSTGQRQLICLARAILRNNSVLVLDEATANIDPETDKFVQSTIRRKFSNCTVITIAHRLHTVMDSDKIMAIDSGTVVEFDTPQNLLDNENSLFHSMAKDAGIV